MGESPRVRLAGCVLFGALATLACSSEPLAPAGEELGAPVPVPTTSTGTGGTGGTSGASSEPGEGDYVLANYPPGPYGRFEGSIIPNLAFRGWHDPEAAGYSWDKTEIVRLSDYYNPDGSKGDLKVLVLNATAVWCTACRSEYQHLLDNDIYATYHKAGVELLGILFEDRYANPAQPADLETWAGTDAYSVKFPFVLDPGFKIGQFFDYDATPMNMIVDTRTMRIVNVSMGYDGSLWQLVDHQLAN